MIKIILSLVLSISFLCADFSSELIKAESEFTKGNYKKASELYYIVLLQPEITEAEFYNHYRNLIISLSNINDMSELDSFRENILFIHNEKWRINSAIADSYLNDGHYGYKIGNEFKRGNQDVDGQWVSCQERDYVRALQIYEKIRLSLINNKIELSDLALRYADAISQVSPNLYFLTNLDLLPECGEEIYSQTSLLAPVDPQENPDYLKLIANFADAKNNGERWRWLLNTASQTENNYIDAIERYARYLNNTFGVQTISDRNFWARSLSNTSLEKYQVHSLSDNETIAKLASGIKRFSIPDEYNPIFVIKNALLKSDSEYRLNELLASIYENRRQYNKALIHLDKIKDNSNIRSRIDQIRKNWVKFEPTKSQSVYSGTKFNITYRNADKVNLEIRKIDVLRLIKDRKAFFSKLKTKYDIEQASQNNLYDIFYEYSLANELGNGKFDKYFEKSISWTEKLEPDPEHYNKQAELKAPISEPGIYYVLAKTIDGNSAATLLLYEPYTIVTRHLNGKMAYIVTDSYTGKPVANVDLHFFGTKIDYQSYTASVSEFTKTSNQDGIVIPENMTDYNWAVYALDQNNVPTILRGTAYSNYHSNYNSDKQKIFITSDRPVYKPADEVKYKAWIRNISYEETENIIPLKNVSVEIYSPRGDKVYTQELNTDDYGGIDGVFKSDAASVLGTYSLILKSGYRTIASYSFNIEEYKKPEYEVLIDVANKKPLLGQPLPIEISAKYYFGQPVTEAKVHYTVTRNSKSNWIYPSCKWDWLYGSGYLYKAYHDYDHYNYSYNRYTQPELVLEGNVEVDLNGKTKFEISTAIAAELYSDTDHEYTITADVVDSSRRTISSVKSVIVPRKPFTVFLNSVGGYYKAGDTAELEIRALTADSTPVQGNGSIKITKLFFDNLGNSTEKQVIANKLATDVDGNANFKFLVPEAGQYKINYSLSDGKTEISESFVLNVFGKTINSNNYKFEKLEIVTDKNEYNPGDTVNLRINSEFKDGTVFLFPKVEANIYPDPIVLYLSNGTAEYQFNIEKRDQPNIFVEAFIIRNGEVTTQVKEVKIPPENKILNIEVITDKNEYKPQDNTKLKLKVTDQKGMPYEGSLLVKVYDKAVDYFSRGSGIGIRDTFWKWKRVYSANNNITSIKNASYIYLQGIETMNDIGIFGGLLSLDGGSPQEEPQALQKMAGAKDGRTFGAVERKKGDSEADMSMDKMEATPAVAQAAVESRSEFVDTIFWAPKLESNKNGIVEANFDLPDNLTTWKIGVNTISKDARVGEATKEIITSKKLILRLQSPRFFIEGDQVILSANIHNYLTSNETVKVKLDISDNFEILEKQEKQITILAGKEQRVDWKVKVLKEGKAEINMTAISDHESDGVKQSFIAYVHGIDKTESFSKVILKNSNEAKIDFEIPAKIKAGTQKLQLNYSPSLALSVVNALPYLIQYPYGCTEQTLNRFLPAAVTKNMLSKIGIKLPDIQSVKTNLNSQMLGDDLRKYSNNPIFSEVELNSVISSGIEKLKTMQISNGSWGWFSGFGVYSDPYITSYVNIALNGAIKNRVVITPEMYSLSTSWLKSYQSKELSLLKHSDSNKRKLRADELDVLVYYALSLSESNNSEMLPYLWKVKNDLSLHTKVLLAQTLVEKEKTKFSEILENIEQHLVEDPENQTAYLKIPDNNYWYWYSREVETNAHYLKLLVKTKQQARASGLVKYLLNNRQNGTHWDSTRSTAEVISAFTDYLLESKEIIPDVSVQVLLDGKLVKQEKITKDNLFTYDSSIKLDNISSGKHILEIKKIGDGNLYVSAYSNYFTLEDFISATGLEIKVKRKYYKLLRKDLDVKNTAVSGLPTDAKKLNYTKVELNNLSELVSGDLVEVELEIDSKNDYEYLLFEDHKPAGLEAVEQISGYLPGASAYVEYRDNLVGVFLSRINRGKTLINYQLRAEIPGSFSALPVIGYGMYAPELKANSDEIKIKVIDK